MAQGIRTLVPGTVVYIVRVVSPREVDVHGRPIAEADIQETTLIGTENFGRWQSFCREKGKTLEVVSVRTADERGILLDDVVKKEN